MCRARPSSFRHNFSVLHTTSKSLHVPHPIEFSTQLFWVSSRLFNLVFGMSLWLPRTPSPFLARISKHAPPNVLHPRIILALHYSNHTLVQPLGLRFQSTQPQPDSSRRASTSTPSSTPHVTSATESKPTSTSSQTKDVSTLKAPLMTRVWKKVKHEAAHYWTGTKLLVSEVRISTRLQWKILHGESLTRRERRQVCIIIRLCRHFILTHLSE